MQHLFAKNLTDTIPLFIPPNFTFSLFFQLTWLALGEDHESRSRGVEQLVAHFIFLRGLWRPGIFVKRLHSTISESGDENLRKLALSPTFLKKMKTSLVAHAENSVQNLFREVVPPSLENAYLIAYPIK